MRILQVQVQNYKSIQDSGSVDFDDVIALVGPNEAGKTAFLQALTKFNPVNSEGTFNPTHDYPRMYLTDYQERHPEDPDPVVTLRLEIGESDLQPLISHYGENILDGETVEVTKYYDGSYRWNIDVDEDVIVEQLIESYELPTSTERSLEDVSTLNELWGRIEDSSADTLQFPEFSANVQEIHQLGLENHVGNSFLREKLPEFLYFDEYHTMEGTVNIHRLASTNESDLTSGENTFLSFLSLAGFNPQELIHMDDFEDVIAQLEAVSESLSRQVFEYWSQGPDLQIRIRDETRVDRHGEEQLHLHVRIYNDRHGNTLPFGERSRGFIWFFSFLAYFSDIQDTYDEGDLVLLLDEPGLNLHAAAQRDLLRFIDERLAPTHPVMYTTHSPFMLEPDRLERARLVEDQDEEETDEIVGTKISDDVLKFKDNTIFPLQAALGIDVIQTLLIGPEVLLLEGPSDIRYLQFMSEILLSEGREHLAQRWTPIPVGGADNAAQFVTLFSGSGLKTVVLLDSDQDVERRMGGVIQRDLIGEDHILTTEQYVGDESDIEDLFSREFYVQLVEDAYQRDITLHDDLDGLELERTDFSHPRIVKEIEHFFQAWNISEGEFNHNEPAKQLAFNRSTYEGHIPEEDKDVFEQLIRDINSLLDG